MKYKLIRSRRKTLGLEVRNGEVTVRAPLFAARSSIDAFVASHSDWIEERLRREQERQQSLAGIQRLTEQELEALRMQAKTIFPQRVSCYAPLVGAVPGRITVRSQRTKWGSCSAKGNLNFNCLLMLAPPEVIDSVVVHELCHRKEMNHSPKFYAEVLRVYPDYQKWHNWLKENGPALMRRIAP